MKVALRFLSSHIQQKLPAIYLDINARNHYKYIINAPAHTQRFLKQNYIDPHPHHVFLFTTTETNNISGLSSLMFRRPQPFYGSSSKIYGDSRLLKYLDEFKYKLGYSIANFSYCSWQGQSRLGVSSAEAIKKMQYDENHIQIFQNLQQHISQHIDKKLHNNALDFYNSKKGIYQDGFVMIKKFDVDYEDTNRSNFIFSIKSDPVFNLSPVRHTDTKVQNSISFNQHFIVLHYKNPHQLTLIANNATFHKQINQFPTNIVLHLIQNPTTLQTNEFQTFIKVFSNQTEHIFLNNSFNQTESGTNYYHLRFVSQLAQYYPQFFPDILANLRSINTAGRSVFAEQTFKYLKCHFYENNQEYILQPTSKRGFKQLFSSNQIISNLIQNHTYNYTEKLPSRESISKMVKHCDPKVIFLGTAASHPNNYRNISSILVDIQNTIIMLDCGQGSFIQFCNHFGSRFNQNLLKTRIIFITHCHSDHVLGVMQFISSRNKLLSPQNHQKLYLIIASNMIPWLDSYCAHIQDIRVGCQVVFVQNVLDLKTNIKTNQQQQISEQRVKIINSKQKCSTNRMYKYDNKKKEVQLVDPFVIEFDHHKKQWIQLIENYRKEQSKVIHDFREYLKSIKIKKFEAIPVLHCSQSYAVILEHQSGIKISYSGDTRPLASFAKAANYSTLLIHQATFKDSDINLAYDYFHSTVSQAIQIGMKSKSWMTALTHFSQSSFRNGEIIDLQGDENWKKLQYAKSNVFLCCDHLQTKISQLDHLPIITKKISKEITQLSNKTR